MQTLQPTSPKRRFGFHRWLIILVVVVSVLAARAFAPIMPHIQLPAEHLAGPIHLPLLGELYLTNTLVAIALVDLVLILLALAVRRRLQRGEQVPGGIVAIVDPVLEALRNLVESTAGKWARRIFPWVATIVLMVLVANWMELFPGVDSIGLLHPAGEGVSYETRELFRIGNLPVATIVRRIEPGATGEALGGVAGQRAGFVPFVRVVSTDLNFTVALAVVSVVMSQVLGIRAAGPGYFRKFFNFGGLARLLFRERLGPFDIITPLTDVFVGLLELVAEIAKIISFSFRLFGNIFAGSVLLFVIGSLVPVMVQSGILVLELFFGLVQALVFGILTLVFMTMATMTHGAGGGEHNPA